MPAKESMFCENCGAQIEENSQYCGQCGTQVFSRDGKQPSTGEAGTNPPTLYQVYSTANKFLYRSVYYDNLRISWFIVGRERPQVPFEKAIINYSKLNAAARIHPENFIKGLFTREEAETLKHYLNSTEMPDTAIEPCLLPVNAHVSGYRDFPAAAGTDFVILHKKENCRLPFKAEGIFNTKMADEHVIADDHTTVVSGINIKEIEEYLKKKEKEKKQKTP